MLHAGRTFAPVQPPHARTARGGGLATQGITWVTLAICVALLVAALSETWVRGGIEQEIASTRAQNAVLAQDVSRTEVAAATARSPQAVERAARGWGYIRPGDQTIYMLPTPTPVPTPRPQH